MTMFKHNQFSLIKTLSNFHIGSLLTSNQFKRMSERKMHTAFNITLIFLLQNNNNHQHVEHFEKY